MTIKLTLHETLDALAAQLGLDAGTLKLYATEDDIGGWHPDPGSRTYDCGAIFGVEGQILYALIRAMKPANVLELGTLTGCSGAHLRAAIKRNGSGELTSVDAYGEAGAIRQTAAEFMQATCKKWDFIFEDSDHARATIAAVWEMAAIKLNGGGVVISHDSLHPTAGMAIMDGIADAGVLADTKHYLTEPSDCGLSVWQRPKPPTELGKKLATVRKIGEQHTESPLDVREKAPKPKRKRGRPKKVAVQEDIMERGGLQITEIEPLGETTDELVG